MVTFQPHALSRTAMLLAVMPLPRPLTLPPTTKMYFMGLLLCLGAGSNGEPGLLAAPDMIVS
jgi:hypothetical protein